MKKLIARHDFEPMQRRILDAAWPCIVGTYRVAGRAKVPTGASRVGGLPDVPAGFEWPVAAEARKKPAAKSARTKAARPLSFMAQINCADVAPFDLEGRLPATGLLSFFYDTENLTSNADGVVFYTPEGCPLTAAAAPPNLAKENRYKPVLVDRFRLGLTIPTPPDDVCRSVLRAGRDKDLDLWDVYRELALAVGDLNGDSSVQLLGYPDFVQYGVTSAKSRLLLELNPPSNYGSGHKVGDLWPSYVLGDTGILYYQVGEADLKKGRFAKAWGSSQCS